MCQNGRYILRKIEGSGGEHPSDTAKVERWEEIEKINVEYKLRAEMNLRVGDHTSASSEAVNRFFRFDTGTHTTQEFLLEECYHWWRRRDAPLSSGGFGDEKYTVLRTLSRVQMKEKMVCCRVEEGRHVSGGGQRLESGQILDEGGTTAMRLDDEQ